MLDNKLGSADPKDIAGGPMGDHRTMPAVSIRSEPLRSHRLTAVVSSRMNGSRRCRHRSGTVMDGHDINSYKHEYRYRE